jgi:succinate dehydrogenase / fumarate reductase cytochrome b subunit
MRFLRFFKTSIGLKIIMAVTGLGLFGFAMVHMLGNLQVFLGPESLNGYAKLLHAEPAILWIFRLALLGMVFLHVVAAIQLTVLNKAARPQNYGEYHPVKATLASRTMIYSGSIVLAFIVFHILHFTTKDIFSEYKDYTTVLKGDEVHDVYRMVVTGFSVPWVSAFYVVSVALLCWHLSHGLSSLFRSLGLSSPAWSPVQELFAKGASVILFLGMASVPVSILLGLVKL